MKKSVVLILLCAAMVLCNTSSARALVVDYDSGTYTTPADWSIIASVPYVDLDHYSYYVLGVSDVDPNARITGLNIVFHDIYNWAIEDNWLRVYLFDEPGFTGYATMGTDWESQGIPNWEADFAATLIGTWSYVNQGRDVVFSTSDPVLLAYLQGGQGFGIGIDPDCHFYGSAVTVETSIPVPEPTTLLLIGTGLLGLAAFRKRS